MMLTMTVLVGFTTVRPIIVDQHVHAITVIGDTEQDCTLTAHAMIACRPTTQMVTSLTIHSLTL